MSKLLPILLLNLHVTLSNKIHLQAQEYLSNIKHRNYQSSHFIAQAASLAPIS